MTELLENVIAQLRMLPSIDQDAIACRLLAEIQDAQRWNKSFAETTDRQWELLADMARQKIASTHLDSSNPANSV
jgi:hypothetical protein